MPEEHPLADDTAASRIDEAFSAAAPPSSSTYQLETDARVWQTCGQGGASICELPVAIEFLDQDFMIVKAVLSLQVGLTRHFGSAAAGLQAGNPQRFVSRLSHIVFKHAVFVAW